MEYSARGGPGIAAAGAAAKLVDPSDFIKLSEITSNVSSLFTQDNSGITSYILLANTALGGPTELFDSNRVEQVGALTRRLVMLNDASNRYKDFKEKNPDAYGVYFKSYADQVNIARSQLIEIINDCASGGSCAPPSDNILYDLKFVEDLFAEVDVSLSCQYQPATKIYPVLTAPVTDPMVLESVSINIVGKSLNPELIDFTSTNIARLTPDNKAVDETERFSGLSLSDADPKGGRRVFGTIYSENLAAQELIKYDAQTRMYIVDTADLQRRRNYILDLSLIHI